MQRLSIVTMIMAWILSGSVISGCGDTAGAPKREIRSAQKSEDVSRRGREDDGETDSSDDSGDASLDADDDASDSGDDGQEPAEEDKDDIEVEDDEKSDEDTSSKKPTDKTKSEPADGTADRHAADITSYRREDSGLTLHVKAGKGDFQSLSWPDDGEAVEMNNICSKGGITTIELEIADPDKGRIKAGSAELGLRKSGAGFVEIGYESQGGCDGKGCQDDNILTISCKDGIKIKGLE